VVRAQTFPGNGEQKYCGRCQIPHLGKKSVLKFAARELILAWLNDIVCLDKEANFLENRFGGWRTIFKLVKI